MLTICLFDSVVIVIGIFHDNIVIVLFFSSPANMTIYITLLFLITSYQHILFSKYHLFGLYIFITSFVVIIIILLPISIILLLTLPRQQLPTLNKRHPRVISITISIDHAMEHLPLIVIDSQLAQLSTLSYING